MAHYHCHLFFRESYFWSDAISDNFLKGALFLITFINVIAEIIQDRQTSLPVLMANIKQRTSL